jgi:hypothetical protein
LLSLIQTRQGTSFALPSLSENKLTKNVKNELKFTRINTTLYKHTVAILKQLNFCRNKVIHAINLSSKKIFCLREFVSINCDKQNKYERATPTKITRSTKTARVLDSVQKMTAGHSAKVNFVSTGQIYNT